MIRKRRVPASILAVVLALAAAGMALAGWRALPPGLIFSDDEALKLAANNGWCITKSLWSSNPLHSGRIHAVFTACDDATSQWKVYHTVSNDLARKWSTTR